MSGGPREALNHYGGLITVTGEILWPAAGPEGGKQLALFQGGED